MSKNNLLPWALASVAALLAGVWLGSALIPKESESLSKAAAGSVRPGTTLGADPPTWRGHVIRLPELRQLVDFKLIQQNGQPLTPADFKGHWSFLYFGYTYCPDVCPLALVDLNRLEQSLPRPGLGDDVAYWFISVDPERDTPQRLGEYVKYFNKNFQGATGDPLELAKLARQLSVVYAIPAHQPGDSYPVDHSSTIVLIDPDARFHAVFMPPHDPEALAADFAKLRESYRIVR
ncbi:MAG: SCO family protein [Candidatus Contendobacter sp.]|nr:SCO family protein [Candidatus Contendobacter sp.]MDG4557031.1 SCO family protein [Candidatus Contendobacter sp.]